MIRTTLCALFGLMTATLIASNAPVAKSQQDEPRSARQPASDKMNPFMHCAKACDDCARACDECSAHCGRMLAEGKKEHHSSLRHLQDCAIICSTASNVMARSGPHSDLICIACAEACKRCGDECEKHAAHDPVMKACAEECRRCEKACRTMLANAGFDPNAKPKR